MNDPWLHSRRKFIAVAGATAALATAPGRAASSAARLDGLSELADSLMQRFRLPSVGVAVILDGRPILTQGLGRADLNLDVAADAHTLYHIGSITKHITALLVLRLVDARKLALDAPIGDFLELPTAWRKLTIQRLLNHTSGLPDYEANLVWDRPYDRLAFRSAQSAIPMDFEQGSSWRYSNTAYLLLGDLIEAVGGQSYPQATRSLFEEAGLISTRLDDAESVIRGRASPYELVGDSYRQAVRMSSSVSAMSDGGVLMSARDAARWLHWLDSTMGLSTAKQREFVHPAMLNTGRAYPYGSGWFLDRLRGQEWLYHAGWVPGFSTYLCRFPAQKLSVAVFSNLSTSMIPQRSIAFELAERIRPNSTPLTLPVLKDTDQAKTVEYENICRNGIRALPSDRFSHELAWAVAKGGDDAVLPNGADVKLIRQVQLVEATREGANFVRRYRIDRTDGVDFHSAGYTHDGKLFRVAFL